MFAYTGGLKGDDGAAGAQGVKGDAGIQGIQGVKGDPGAGSFASYVRAYRSAEQDIVKDTWVKIEFETEQYDNNSEYDHVTNFRWTCKNAGKYHLDTGVPITPIAVGETVLLVVKLGGSLDIFYDENRPGFGGQVKVSASGDYEFAQDDYIEVFVFHTEAQTEKTYHASGDPWFNIRRVA